jgi:signal transduction histidine kinase
MSDSTALPKPVDSRPSARKSAWERWVKVWYVVFYFSLTLPTGFAVFADNLPYSPWWVIALSLFLGAWFWLILIWFVPKAQKKWQVSGTLIYLFIAVGAWLPLSQAHPAYYLTASSFYGLMWGTLPFGLAVVGNILLTGLIIWSRALNTGQPIVLSLNMLLISGVVVGWSVLLALWMRSVMRESAERKRLIEKLEETQRSLAAMERQAGVLQERQRIAQEIHDTLAQSFTSIVMQLEAADQALPEQETSGRSRILRARETARAGLVESRRLMQALRPAQLEEASLSEALARVIHRVMQETNLKISFAVTGTPHPLHPEVEVTLLRALQEGLSNIQKHARARQANVTLSYMEDQLALDIQDDGSGFDPEVLHRKTAGSLGGFGLEVMRSRVAQFGGELIVESTPGQGTTLVIQIPLEVNG